jgi:hypothetical protein
MLRTAEEAERRYLRATRWEQVQVTQGVVFSPGELGVAGEEAAAEAYGIVKNEEAIRFAGRNIKPDVVNDVAKVIGEIKNVGYQALTGQLRQYIAFAAAQGYAFNLYI